MSAQPKYDYRFTKNAKILIYAPSGSGKTHLMSKLLRERKHHFQAPFRECYLYYQYEQPIYDSLLLDGNITKKYKGLPSMDFLEAISDPNGPPIGIVLDDASSHLNRDMEALFLRAGRHLNFCIFLLLQNFFSEKPLEKSINHNCTDIIALKNMRNAMTINHIGRQCFPYKSKYFTTAFAHSTKLPYSYLIISLDPSVPDELRLKSRIFLDEQPIVVYVPKT